MATPTAPILDAALRSWLHDRVGPVEPVARLVGGITAEITRLRPSGADGTGDGDLVLRRWPGREDAAEEEAAVRREAAGLAVLERAGFPAPRLLAADPTGQEAGSRVSVTGFLPGRVRLAPRDPQAWVGQLAATLARLHAVPAPEHLVHRGNGESEGHDWLVEADPGLAREALDLAGRAREDTQVVFAHGDYQHFNVLWRGERVSAVVDWPGAARSVRGLDVGHCRLNLAVLHSADLAMDFLDRYQERSGVLVDPAADVRRLLGYGPDWPEFLPRQVAGRAPLDAAGMPGRVVETLRRTLRHAG